MLEWITERLLTFLGQAEELRKDRREVADNALRSVSHALRETTLYFRHLDKGGREPEREAQLCHLWSAAAIPVRHIDEELAQICEHKADYWLNPENWTRAEIERHRIDLDSVQGRYRTLLVPAGGWSRLNRSSESQN